MILVGNQRGGAKDLALHLLKEENEHVEVHEVRGFASQNLAAALTESYAISRATKCRRYLFSLSLNPPPNEDCRLRYLSQRLTAWRKGLAFRDNRAPSSFMKRKAAGTATRFGQELTRTK
ncbi:MAG: hypothetical protein ACRERU_00920 [Methylococcales bacterium]